GILTTNTKAIPSLVHPFASQTRMSVIFERRKKKEIPAKTYSFFGIFN
ncbi:MAG: hypothetical protein ACI8RD_008791, partial [Bacillariaceae sp.]